ncbi:MAG: DUF4253 domain-containing protein [Planctomycetes bacterium]|nr:DUF4253 domain-containing protein [Planctomycetota bacterium]
MADPDLRELERRWAEGAGELAVGEALARALERAGAPGGRLLEVRLQALRRHLQTIGLDPTTLAPLPEVDPLAAVLSVPGVEALSAWHRLRRLTQATGAFPVLLGQHHERVLERLHESAHDLSVEETLAGAERLGDPFDVVSWAVRERQVSLPDDEDWPANEVPASHDFVVPLDPEGWSPQASMHVALLPTRSPWEAAAHLRFGVTPWEGPPPAVHVALHRHWYQAFGAEVVALTHAEAELIVPRGPSTRAAAQVLAREHESYCPGVAGTTSEALGVHAASLLGATNWYFSWGPE